VFVLQTRGSYILSFEFHDLHISVSISRCSWCEFHTDIWNMRYLNDVKLHNLNAYLCGEGMCRHGDSNLQMLSSYQR
jgi:hypothetical protein